MDLVLYFVPKRCVSNFWAESEDFSRGIWTDIRIGRHLPKSPSLKQKFGFYSAFVQIEACMPPKIIEVEKFQFSIFAKNYT